MLMTSPIGFEIALTNFEAMLKHHISVEKTLKRGCATLRIPLFQHFETLYSSWITTLYHC